MKRLLQKFSFFLLLVLFLLPPGYAAAAVTGDNDEALLSLNVSNVILDKTDYKAGEDIHGNFTIENHSGFAVHNLSFRIQIASDYEEPIPGTKFPRTFLDASSRGGSIDLRVNEKQTISFVYRIPSFVSGEKLGVSIDIFSGAGNFVSFADSEYISIEKTEQSVVIKNVELTLSNGLKFNITEGPTIYKDKEPSKAFAEITLYNASKSAVNIVPGIKVYEQKNAKDFQSYKSDTLTIGAGKTEIIKVVLPTMSYRPGVYFAEIMLRDDKGVQIATLIGARYIIGGNIATVHSALVDKDVLAQNEKFNFSATLTGKPFDIALLSDKNNTSLGDDAVGKIESKIYNEKDEEVASFTDDFYVSGETYIEDELYAASPSRALRLEMDVFDNADVLLTSYKQNLSEDYEKIAEESRKATPFGINPSTILWGVGIAIVFLIIILLIMKNRNRAASTLALFLIVMATLSLATDDSFAKAKKGKSAPRNVGCSPAAVSVRPTSPYANQNFAPGATFYTQGVVSYVSCDNSATVVDIVVTGPKGDVIRRPAYFVTGAIGGHGWTGGRGGAFTIGSFNAPDNPGTYNVRFQVHSQAGICGTNASANVPIVVTGTPTNSSPTGGGCSTGQFYCELFRQCIPTNQQCNDANPEYKPFRINPNMLANEGPVKLRSLSASPPLGAPGYSCRISWSNSFISYDENTICTFTGPNNVSLNFSPGSTTAPTSYQSPALQQDSVFKMSCSEGANTAVEKVETVCRLNWNYEEVP